MDVDAVQQRAGDALLVQRPESLTGLGDSRRGAGTGLDRVSVISAGTGIPAIPLKSCGTFTHCFRAKCRI